MTGNPLPFARRISVPGLTFASILILALAAFTAPGARAVETVAEEAYMIDAQTGTVLLDKNGDKAMPPSSMSKMMTVYMLFDKIKSGALSLDDTFLVSKKAWQKGGSKMFVEVNKRIPIHDLLRGIIVQSGNDACIVVAEGVAGTEEAFAEMLNAKAKQIGLRDSHFVNASGWPADGHVMSARDIAQLSLRTIRDFPELYKIYAEKRFTYHGISQSNRNPLLFTTPGADGLKTGHTEAAGYGLAGSVERDGRRLILVLNGLPSNRARTTESQRLMEWGFREFENFALFKKGDTVEQAEIWLGQDAAVPLVVDRDVTVTLPRRARKLAKVSVNYTGPIPAPVVEGQEIATLRIDAPDIETIEIPLKAGKAVDRLGFFGRIKAGLGHLIWGNLR